MGDQPNWHALEVRPVTRELRKELRRLARTAQDPHHRRRALLILGRRDPGAATGHICERLLRLDENAGVRVAAAACLGHQGAQGAAPHLPALAQALSDHRDVVQMAAAEALARVGDSASLIKVREASKKTTGTTSDALGRAADRGESRIAQAAMASAESPHGDFSSDHSPQGIPAAQTLMPGGTWLGPTLSGAWLGLYAASAGWLVGGTLPLVLGQEGLLQTGPLLSFGVGTAFFAAGAVWGGGMLPSFRQAHTVVHFGGLGMLLGSGAGFLTAPTGAEAPRMAAGGALGMLTGTATGLVLAHSAPPTPGALALGTTVAGGAGLSLVALSGSLGFRSTPAFAVAAMGTGLIGQVTTLAAAPFDIGLFPILGSTLGGILFATLASYTQGLNEAIQGVEIPDRGSEARGWSVFGGYVIGAVAGGLGASLIPGDWDPLLAMDLSPTVTTLPPAALGAAPKEGVVLGLSGRF
jgi:hypothetical protein